MRTLQIKAQEKHGGTSPASLSDPEAPPSLGQHSPAPPGRKKVWGVGSASASGRHLLIRPHRELD